jgi:hypothetical protein
MAKPTKVKYDVSDDDCESDDCRSDDEEEEYTKEELLDMCEQVHTCFEMKRKECKELHKRVKSLEQSFDELNATHERLMELMRSLAKLTLSLKRLTPLSLSKSRRRKPRRSK